MGLRNLQTVRKNCLMRGIRLLEPKWANSVEYSSACRTGSTFAPILLNPHLPGCAPARAMQGVRTLFGWRLDRLKTACDP